MAFESSKREPRRAAIPLLFLSLLPTCLPVALVLGDTDSADREPPHRVVAIQGKVVWLAEALERLHGVKTVIEAKERTLALETADGSLHPLVEDVRGRAFRRDQRLRGIPVEVLARQHRRSPMVQVIKLFSLEGGKKQELDYWCEICAIAMFELKACDCCQGPIELRRRPQ